MQFKLYVMMSGSIINISKEIRNPGFKSRTGKEVRADLIAELAYLQLFSRMKHYKCYG